MIICYKISVINCKFCLWYLKWFLFENRRCHSLRFFSCKNFFIFHSNSAVILWYFFLILKRYSEHKKFESAILLPQFLCSELSRDPNDDEVSKWLVNLPVYYWEVYDIYFRIIFSHFQIYIVAYSKERGALLSKSELYLTTDGGATFSMITIPFVLDGTLVFHPNKKYRDYIMTFSSTQNVSRNFRKMKVKNFSMTECNCSC